MHVWWNAQFVRQIVRFAEFQDLAWVRVRIFWIQSSDLSNGVSLTSYS
jgi:hypothetical protein